jgi:hypothetical protein
LSAFPSVENEKVEALTKIIPPRAPSMDKEMPLVIQ